MDNPMVQELAQLIMDSANGYVAGIIGLEDHQNNASIWWAKAEKESIDKEVAKVVFRHFYKQMLDRNAEMKELDERYDISNSIPDLEEQ